MSAQMSNEGSRARAVNPFALDQVTAYAQWRAWKLAQRPQSTDDLLVPVADPYRLSAEEHAAIVASCRRSNMAIYALAADAGADKEAIRALGEQLGLRRLDSNLGADDDGITSLRVVQGDRRTGYIPYTNRRLSWHTDGYYNRLDRQIRAAVMHCVSNAARGGANALLDHELVYIQLRDRNPAWIAALMQPDAMTIPPNHEGGEEIRGAQSGPVFSVEPATGSLHMRYSARTRNIEWKQDADTQAAVSALTELMAEGAPDVLAHRLQAGQGIICNNVLHCRTSFEDDAADGRQRLLYRARYYDRIAGTAVADLDWQRN